MSIDELQLAVRELARQQRASVTDSLSSPCIAADCSLECRRQFLGFETSSDALTRRNSLIRSRTSRSTTDQVLPVVSYLAGSFGSWCRRDHFG